MPDFTPMILRALPVLFCLGLFVGVVQLVAFVARRWKNV